jgi:C4-dicarboxylate transporter DctM subunit
MVLIIGMFMEMVSTLIILTPILLVITDAIGVDPFHLGVILVFNLEIGMFTPPLGVGVYTVSNVGNVPPDKVFRELLTLYWPLLIALLIITFFFQKCLYGYPVWSDEGKMP